MKDYKVLSPFKDADGIHKPDDTVSLSDKDADELLELGAIEESAQSTVPADAETRQTAIIDAIGTLDPANEDLWLRDGKPDTNAIAEIIGWAVTAGERNAAWATIQSAKG